MNAKLLVTDSYFNIFPLLTDELRGKTGDLTQKNFVFIEEKLSLMAERVIADAFGGTFNTEVYSFGNFLRAKKTVSGLLSKEGSAMVVKKILSLLPLKCFNRGKINLAPTLFELISQLKSAKVYPSDISRAAENVSGVLKEKLSDIAAVFSAYETYLAEKGLSDQSSALSLLPDIINGDEDVSGANVFIVGFSGFTMQIRKVISALLSRAKSVTAILTGGENKFAFVNETADVFRNLCADLNISVSEKFVKSEYSAGGNILKDGLFNPLFFLNNKNFKKPQAFFLAAKTVNAETERIAEVIKRKVIDGECRYRDFTVIVPDGDEYKEALSRSFARLSVPNFTDVKRRPENFPLPALIYAYCDLFIRGLKISQLSAFFKNPYIPFDRDFKDKFENYLYKYDVCYGKFRKPLAFPADSDEELKSFEEFRTFLCGFLNKFDVYGLLSRLNADEMTEELSCRLFDEQETEDAEINRQVLNKVNEVLSEIKVVMPSLENEPLEFKNVFASGMSAMEVSVIPQYNDAVFVGNFKQAAISKAKYLFAAGLTSAVPSFCDDVALLTDGDIDALAELKVLIEPKINVVNHRLREEIALGLSAYDKGLYLSYPLSDYSGGQTVKSGILDFTERCFMYKDFPPYDGYITKAQGLRSFARDCNRFAALKLNDFSAQSAFYATAKESAARIAEYANKEVKIRLDGKKGALTGGIISPTAIEDYYSCPYRSFLTHTLKVVQRDTGKVNALSVGNLMHEIFKEFIGRVELVADKESSDKVFGEAAAKILAKPEYARYDDAESAYGIELALNECKKYCRKMSEFFTSSEFKPRKNTLEVRFADGAEQAGGYPAVSLSGGKVKLSGKIDRIDEYKDYFRIIDYKTGGSEVTDEKIFAGVKLQLYLYSLAVTDKTLAGAYYLRVNDEYRAEDEKNKPLMEGKTAVDVEGVIDREAEFLPLSGKNKAVNIKTLAGVKEYARKMAERAAEQLDDGVIIPSPYSGVCEYCEFSSVCREKLAERKVSGVDTEYIAESAREDGSENV